MVDLSYIAKNAEKNKGVDIAAREKKGQEMTREKAQALFANAYQQVTQLDPRDAALVEYRTGFGYQWAFVPRNPLDNFPPADRDTILHALEFVARHKDIVAHDDDPGVIAENLLKKLAPKENSSE